MNKGGLSPVIGVVLLIVLGVSIAGIIFLWAQGYISSSANKAELERLKGELCPVVKISIDESCFQSDNVESYSTGDDISKKRVVLIIGNDNPKQEITGFVIRIDSAGSSTNTQSLPYSEIGGFGSGEISTDYIDSEDFSQLRIIPKIKTERGIVVCDENEEIVQRGVIDDSC